MGKIIATRLSMENCIFCQIIEHRLPAEILYEDERMIVIRDAHPLCEVHLLVIPYKHIPSLNEIGKADEELLAALLIKAREIAFAQGIGESGYRVAINTGAGGGQTIFHLHVHILAGKSADAHLLTRGLK
jgi:histidine triad (HIT) family protein